MAEVLKKEDLSSFPPHVCTLQTFPKANENVFACNPEGGHGRSHMELKELAGVISRTLLKFGCIKTKSFNCRNTGKIYLATRDEKKPDKILNTQQISL